jgi:CheY-like chemotaxis protein
MLTTGIVSEKELYTAQMLEKRRQVLVVDDNEAVRDVLSRVFSSLGYSVTVAVNGLEGGTFFLTGSYDLVVTDLQMPLMNGWELSRLVKERSPETPVVVITGCPGETHRGAMERNCVDAVIPKPFRIEEIERTVRSLVK